MKSGLRETDPAAGTARRERGLNFYQGEYLAKVERTLRHAEATRSTEHDSWLNAYQEHVRWLVDQLKMRLPNA